MGIKYDKQYAIRKAKELAKVLRDNNIKIQAMYLFGSFANDDEANLEWSDIDIAIVSESFMGFRLEDNKMLIPLVVKVEPRIETHPFTPADFENSPFTKNEIEKKGILLET
ncbi:MAG: nucleotidyltransferase domain-containing protein [Ignavibacteria bacterium]|nr:nucleotidyltransferase domain-containing protein [Ignavibacteria bacterium]